MVIGGHGASPEKKTLKNDKIPPKITGLVWDRIYTKAEMASLHVVAVQGVIKNRRPIFEIFNFISITIARLEEVLYMEWEDFDEKTGILTILDQNLGAILSTD